MSNEPLTPKRLSLTVRGSFKASHSLENFEQAHFHLWNLSAEFESTLPLENDRLIDLVYLQEILKNICEPVDGKYLNQLFSFSPTSENIAQWFWAELVQKLPGAPLSSVEVSLCDLEGRSTGAARLYR